MSERTKAIVDTAYDLLDEAGLEGLTIRAVLARSGLARRAFYDRFGGKDDLVLAVFEQTLQAAASFFAEQASGLINPMERLRYIVTGIVMGRATFGADGEWENSKRSAALSREHLRLAESRPVELQKAIAPLVELIAVELEKAMGAGLVRRAPSHRLAVLVYNLVSTTVHTELLAEEGSAPDRARREALAEEIWEFCRRAIAA